LKYKGIHSSYEERNGSRYLDSIGRLLPLDSVAATIIRWVQLGPHWRCNCRSNISDFSVGICNDIEGFDIADVLKAI